MDFKSLSAFTEKIELARTLRDQGQLEEAEKLQLHVLEAYKDKFGLRHSPTLVIMDDLASTFRDQGRWEEAEKLETQSEEIRKTLPGPDFHFPPAVQKANLASNLQREGRTEEAKEQYMQAIEGFKTIFGPEDICTRTLIRQFEQLLQQQAESELYKEIYPQIYSQIYNIVPDVEHRIPDAMRLADLGSRIWRPDEPDGAMGRYTQAMEAFKTEHGCDSHYARAVTDQVLMLLQKRAQFLHVKTREAMERTELADHLIEQPWPGQR